MLMKRTDVLSYLAILMIVLLLGFFFILPVAQPAPFFRGVADDIFNSTFLDTIGFRDVTYFTVLYEALNKGNQSVTTRLLLTGSENLVSAIADIYKSFQGSDQKIYTPPMIQYGLLMLLALLGLILTGVLQGFRQIRTKTRYAVALAAAVITLISDVLLWIRIGLVNKAFLGYLDDAKEASFVDVRMIKPGSGIFLILVAALVLLGLSAAALLMPSARTRQIRSAGFERYPGGQPAGGTIRGLTGTYKNGAFRLNDGETVVFGRDAQECQIVFDQYDADISRKHCTISYQTAIGKYIVTDHSRNGTFTADGSRLSENIPVVLERGTVIYLGNRKNIFRLE